MIKIINPTDKDLAIIFKGTKEILEAGADRIVSDELANFWKDIHQFLFIKNILGDVSKKKEEVVEEKKEVDLDEALESVREVAGKAVGVVKEGLRRDKKGNKSKKK